jgi:hypothetical protein
MTKARFRAAVVLSMALAIVALVLALARESTLPPSLREYLEQQRSREATAADWALVLATIPLSAGGFVSFVGMLRFRTWSRPLAIAVSGLGVVGLPLFGPTVEPGLATALYHLSSMSFGAVVATSYFSPVVRGWFEHERPP